MSLISWSRRVWASFYVFTLLSAIVRSAVPQGPKSVAPGPGNSEVWIYVDGSGTIDTFGVRDYGLLAPTVVYNCAYMPAICNNIEAHLGHLPDAGLEETYHYDISQERKDSRRDQVCPKQTWIQRRRAGGEYWCPEPNQPAWTGYDSDGNKFGPFTAQLSGLPKANGQPTYNRLATTRTKIKFEDDGTLTTEQQWVELGAIMSCDEFPAASWIEGGGAQGAIGVASTYCAPIKGGCGDITGIPLASDQNWQAAVHARLRDWFNKLSGQRISASGPPHLQYSIFKFKLRTVNLPASTHASWIEANGVLRYCLAPGQSSSGQIAGCSSDILATDPVPVNPP